MKQFAKITLHNRKEQIKNEFHNSLNEAFSVKYSESELNDEAIGFNNLLKDIFSKIKEYFYAELPEMKWTPESELKKMEKEEVEKTKKDEFKKYEDLQENCLRVKEDKKEMDFNPNIKGFLNHLKIIFSFPKKNTSPAGQINPDNIIFKDGRIDYAELYLDIPINFFLFNQYVRSTIRHELFHLYQFNTWDVFGSNEFIYKNAEKYSTSYMEKLLQTYADDHSINVEDMIANETINIIEPYNISPESIYKVMHNIVWICYYINPIEMQAFLQTSYQDYLGYNFYSSHPNISKVPLNILEARLNVLQDILISPNKSVFEEETRKTLGDEIELILRIPFNSTSLLEKIYKKGSRIYQDFAYRWRKVIYLAKLEKGELDSDTVKKKMITDRKIDESGKITFITDSLDNIAMYNFPLYEHCLEIIETFKERIKLYSHDKDEHISQSINESIIKSITIPYQ